MIKTKQNKKPPPSYYEFLGETKVAPWVIEDGWWVIHSKPEIIQILCLTYTALIQCDGLMLLHNLIQQMGIMVLVLNQEFYLLIFLQKENSVNTDQTLRVRSHELVDQASIWVVSSSSCAPKSAPGGDGGGQRTFRSRSECKGTLWVRQRTGQSLCNKEKFAQQMYECMRISTKHGVSASLMLFSPKSWTCYFNCDLFTGNAENGPGMGPSLVSVANLWIIEYKP